jgi:hypothetical protein
MNVVHFDVQMHLGPLLGMHLPKPVGFQSPLAHAAGIQVASKGPVILASKWGRPIPLVRPNQAGGSPIKAGAQGWLLLPQTELHLLEFEFHLPLFLFLCSGSKSNRKRKKICLIFCSICISCFLPFTLQEHVCGGTITPQE